MMKLEILRRQVSIGSYVTLRLTRGDDVSGRIDELDDAYVRLSRDGTTGTVFEEELAGWNVHPRDVPGDVAERVVVSTPPPERDDSRMPPAGPQTADDSDPEAAPRFERVKAEFSAALQHTGLQHPEPDFQFPETEFAPALAPDLRREWDRARNQYDYALKVREIGRLNSVVAQILDPLGKRCPQSPAMRSLLGRVLLKTGSSVRRRRPSLRGGLPFEYTGTLAGSRIRGRPGHGGPMLRAPPLLPLDAAIARR